MEQIFFNWQTIPLQVSKKQALKGQAEERQASKKLIWRWRNYSNCASLQRKKDQGIAQIWERVTSLISLFEKENLLSRWIIWSW